MISVILTLIVYLIVLGILWYLVDYGLRLFPLPDPPARLIRFFVIVLFCIIVIVLLLDLVGVSTGVKLPRL
jgi:hypothetical protein